jgi:hypothetical protein
VLFYSFLALSMAWVLGIYSARRLARHLPESLKRGQLPLGARRQMARRASQRH